MKQAHQRYMEEAIELAKTSDMEMKHGCVIVNARSRDRPVVARGVNQHVFNLEGRRVYSRHAEMDAVAHLLAIKSHNSSFFENCIAFVARVGPASSGHQIRMSRPCRDCQRLLQKIGIQRVYYTHDNRTVCAMIAFDYGRK